MSVGLIDWIFENLDIQNLDRKEVLEYLVYLREITNQDTYFSKTNKINGYRVKLESRLVQLDKELLESYSRIQLGKIDTKNLYPFQKENIQANNTKYTSI